MKLLLLPLFALSLYSQEPIKEIPLNKNIQKEEIKPKTFVDRISINFEDIKKRSFKKYDIYIATRNCIIKSKSSSDIRLCETMSKSKLIAFSQNDKEDLSSLNDEYLEQLKLEQSLPEYKKTYKENKPILKKDSKIPIKENKN